MRDFMAISESQIQKCKVICKETQCGHMQKHMEAEVHEGKLTYTDAQEPRYTHTYRWTSLRASTNTCTYCVYKQAQGYKGTQGRSITILLSLDPLPWALIGILHLPRPPHTNTVCRAEPSQWRSHSQNFRLCGRMIVQLCTWACWSKSPDT